MAHVVYGLNDDLLDDPQRTISRAPEEPRDSDRRPSAGRLLDLARSENPDERRRAAQEIQARWRDASTTEAHGRRQAQWKANRLRRLGVPNVRVVKAENEARYTVWAPPGVHAAMPMVNHAATLCRKLTANLWADPPAPDSVPASGEDTDRDAAELADRVLVDLQSESKLQTVSKGRRAFDRAHTYGSGFEWLFVDPTGGGLQPLSVLASQQAVTLDDALTAPRPYVVRYATTEQDYQPPPTLRSVGVDALGQPVTEAVPEPPRRARLLVDDPSQADRQWVPGLRSEVLTPQHIRLLPVTSEDVWDAEGVLKGAFLSWGEAKRLWPQLDALPAPERGRLFGFRPEAATDLLPVGLRDPDSLRGDDRLVWTVTAVWKVSPAYPEGAYLIAVGDQDVPVAEPWQNRQTGEPLDLPLTQYRGWDEGRDDPYGVATMELLGMGNEGRAAQIGSLITHLDRFNNRKVFYPTNSILNPKQAQLATGTYLPINPGGKPEFEDVPPYPSESIQAFDLLTKEMDNSVSLTEIAQGLNSPSVQSGRHAFQVVSQAHAGLSELKQHIERAYERGSRIQLQLVKAFFSKLQRVQFATEDGQYREKWFTGADLGSTRDVRVRPGTMTLMSPTAKVQMAVEWVQLGLLDAETAQSAFYTGMGPVLGVRDHPARMRVRQQMADWAEGPPATGDLAQHAAQVFEPVPSDLLPGFASIRLSELARFSQGTRYRRWSPDWRAVLDQELARMQAATAPGPAAPTGSPAESGPLPVGPPAAVPPDVNPATPPLDNPTLDQAGAL